MNDTMASVIAICFTTAVSARNNCQAFCVNQWVWWSHKRPLFTKLLQTTIWIDWQWY